MLLLYSVDELLGEWRGICAPSRTDRAMDMPSNQHSPATWLPQDLSFPSPGTLLACTQFGFSPGASSDPPQAAAFNHPHTCPSTHCFRIINEGVRFVVSIPQINQVLNTVLSTSLATLNNKRLTTSSSFFSSYHRDSPDTGH